MRTLIYMDTGGSGALAWRGPDGETWVTDLPVTVFKFKNGKEKTEVDAESLSDAIAIVTGGEPSTIGVEALPGTSKGSVWSAMLQGANFGRCEAVARLTSGAIAETHRAVDVRAALGITVKVTKVGKKATAQEKAAAKVKRKETACAYAAERFPHLRAQIYPPAGGRKKKPYDGRADALCGLAYLIDREEREG